MTQDFDFATLLNSLADWPAAPISDRKAADPVLERIRQVLRRLQAAPYSSDTSDLVPLLRQASLARGVSGQAPRMRVPVAPGWPTVASWQGNGFEVQAHGTWLVVQATPPRLDFLGPQANLFEDAFARVYARVDTRVEADPVFKRLLRLSTYTGPGQREAVRALIQLPPGETLIANLPTGGGKSVLAQLPPLLANRGCITVAIVPTVALAIDQAERMRSILLAQDAHASIPPLAYHGGLDETQRREVWQAIRDGRQPILFLSPEHATSTLRSALEEAAREGRLSHVVVDEAHLVIGWGNGFRPAFQLLPALIRKLQRMASGSSLRLVLASATLTGATIEALKQLFSVGQRIHLVAGVYLRPEPRYAFSHAENESVRQHRILEAVRTAPRPLILYVTRPDEAERWERELRASGYARLAIFTGKTNAMERETLLGRWRANEIDVMVATSAFGLGVDKGDVRTIIHATLPESLDRYYQEVGRSGRDGWASASVVVYTDEDIRQARRMAVSKVARERTAFERWSLMVQQAQPDPQQADVFWLNLRRLPARLVQHSDASAGWNIKTLTLMVRAGMLELVALARSRGDEDGRELTSEEDAQFAAVKLLKDDLRREDAFHAALSLGRARVREAGDAGYRAMLSVVSGRTEIAQALHETYSVISNGVWSPVSQYCGGCPRHWGMNRWPGGPVAPVVPRLDHFGAREQYKNWVARWPMVGDNLLVVAVPADARFESQCIAVTRVLVYAFQPHTLVLGRRLAAKFENSMVHGSGQSPASWPFVESLGYFGTTILRAGEHEVRLTVWDLDSPAPIPDGLWASRGALEVLIIPDSTVHPVHPGRRLIDTTPHLYAEQVVNELSS